jgi:succinyl-diaminopimelate desuccinylase
VTLPHDDLFALTAALVDVPSVSHHERALADMIEAELRTVPWLTVDRHLDNVVARTTLGRPQRVILAGHTDTVPVNGNDRARIDGDTLWGLGAADMKGGLAVMLHLARTLAEPGPDLTYVFYAGEEVAAEHNGLGHLFRDRPDLLDGDVALLGEPTSGDVEAGCQGSLRVRVCLTGSRAHTARPWVGRNAIHRLGRLLAILDDYQERRPVIDGCEYREAIQAVSVEGGVAGNVVPDMAIVVVNHRFAPDRTVDEAFAHVRDLVAPVMDDDDTIDLVDAAAGARPGLDHPLLRAIVDRPDVDVRAKLGWTDVAVFSAHGLPAANFGPGDPLVAHTAGEHVSRAEIERVAATLDVVLRRAPTP